VHYSVLVELGVIRQRRYFRFFLVRRGGFSFFRSGELCWIGRIDGNGVNVSE